MTSPLVGLPLLQDKYSEAIHNLAKMWPDEGSLEVSFREVEGYDHEFAQDILPTPNTISEPPIKRCVNSCWTPVKAT